MEDKKQPPVGERLRILLKERPWSVLFAAAVLLIIGVIAYWAIWADSSPAWTGFGAYDERAAGPRAKTLWDWLVLLIVPAALGAGAYWLNRSQKETELKIAEKARAAEREIADSRQKQVTLEAYYDRMTELLLKHGLRESAADSEVRSIARARTVAVVKSLDGERNGQLFSFLKASKLMEREFPIIDPIEVDFSGADMHGADMFEANLSGARLSGANLEGANLSRSNLSRANLRRANLRWANLSWVDLNRAGLSGADLSWANLSGADLSGADLSWIDLTGADLSEANFSGANLSKANLAVAKLSRANLRWANLSEANLNAVDLSAANLVETNLYMVDLDIAVLSGANLSGANLSKANLSRASLYKAHLRGAKNWTIEQFDKISNLEGATTPDGISLGDWDNDGPTYDEWKAQYLAKQGEQRA